VELLAQTQSLQWLSVLETTGNWTDKAVVGGRGHNFESGGKVGGKESLGQLKLHREPFGHAGRRDRRVHVITSPGPNLDRGIAAPRTVQDDAVLGDVAGKVLDPGCETRGWVASESVEPHDTVGTQPRVAPVPRLNGCHERDGAPVLVMVANALEDEFRIADGEIHIDIGVGQRVGPAHVGTHDLVGVRSISAARVVSWGNLMR